MVEIKVRSAHEMKKTARLNGGVVSDATLHEFIDCGIIYYPAGSGMLIDNLHDNVSPASIDLTLLGSVVIHENGEREPLLFSDTYNLKAGEFILMSTNEAVDMPNDFVGIVKGKSSLARKGLMVECAGFIDPGFDGQITLEIKNLNQKRDILLRDGMKICQIVFTRMAEATTDGYSKETGHHYQGQRGATRAFDD